MDSSAIHHPISSVANEKRRHDSRRARASATTLLAVALVS